jgi:effector-binding domain-containing protein
MYEYRRYLVKKVTDQNVRVIRECYEQINNFTLPEKTEPNITVEISISLERA